MWQIIFLLVISAVLVGLSWMAFAVCRFRSLGRIVPKKKWKRLLMGLLIVIPIMVAVCLSLGFVNMVIMYLHLLIIWMVFDCVAFIVKKTTRKQGRHYYSGIAAIAFTTIWLSIGWYNAHEVKRTEYNISTSKLLGVDNLKVIGLSDSHVGATFHWQEFEEYVDRINEEKPDMVVIMGDFVDDDTSKEDMVRSCEALKRIKTKYGVYYVYGNHDEGYWTNDRRGYTLQDLERLLAENNVRVLRDENVEIAGNIVLCGRLDRTFASLKDRSRKTPAELTQGIDDKYVICLDHQPNDYDAEADSNMDLVISGHTHGGQFLGLGEIGVCMGANDAYYGHERRKNTDFIVSSGIGDWAIDFKTGCVAEYVVINIK